MLISEDKEAEELLLSTGLNRYFYDDNKENLKDKFKCRTTKGLTTLEVLKCFNILGAVTGVMSENF